MGYALAHDPFKVGNSSKALYIQGSVPDASKYVVAKVEPMMVPAVLKQAVRWEVEAGLQPSWWLMGVPINHSPSKS